tara:strand:- start:66 stop:866 length:801 start_codon:yes stop_codon:yes gene_type:complete
MLTTLVSCGDSSEDKVTKRICNDFEKRIFVNKEKCFKDKEYFKELRFQHDVAIQIEKIDKFNNKVDKFNQVDIGTIDKDFLLIDIEDFIKKNKINEEKYFLRLNNDSIRKKLKFKSYFELEAQENSGVYTINFYNYMQNIFSSAENRQQNVPILSSAKFQNIETKNKVETVMKTNGNIRSAIPLNDDSSTIYGYFINRKFNSNNSNDLLLIIGNKNFKYSNIKDIDFLISEFYITDIKLEKISYQQKEVENFVRQNKILITMDNMN